jgi:hypothetical protein
MLSPNHPKLRSIGIAVTVVIAGVIAFLTLAPVSSIVMPGSDKLYHALAFAALAFPLPVLRPQMALAVFVGVIGYGGFIEFIQPMFGRSAEIADLFADGVGAAIGVGSGLVLGRVWRHAAMR